MARLSLTQAAGEKVFPLGTSATIGRDPQAEVPIDDQAASRHHARIERRGDDFVIVDLESRNGTLVNGEKVKEHTLADGDRIRIGGKEFTFWLTAPFSLKIVAGERAGETRAMDVERVTFGRKPENTIVLNEVGVSGVHCEVVIENGRPVLRDLGSTNGTLLENQKIDEVVLSHGDRFRLGSTEVVLVDAKAGALPGEAPAAAEDAGEEVKLLKAPRKSKVLSALVPLVLLAALGGAGYYYFNFMRGKVGVRRMQVAPQPGNLIVDDWSFEEDDFLTQRYDLGGEGLKSFRFVSEHGKSGAGAVSASLETGSRAQLAPKQNLSVDPEHKYRLVVQVKGDESAMAVLGARLQGPYGQEIELPLAARPASASYAALEAELIMPAGIRLMRPVVGAFGTGRVQIDDLEVFDQGPAGAASKVHDFESLVAGSAFMLSQIKTILLIGGLVELMRDDKPLPPATVDAHVTLKPGDKSYEGEWVVRGLQGGDAVTCGFVITGALGGRVRTMSDQGTLLRDGAFDATPCQSALLGDGNDLVHLRFASPQQVSGRPLPEGGYGLSVAPTVEGGTATLKFTLDVFFQDERLRAQELLSEAENLIKHGKYGEADERTRKVTDELPFHEVELAKARELAGAIAAEGRKRQANVETLLADAVFLANPQKFAEAEQAARDAQAAFAGAPIADTFKNLVEQAASEKARFEAQRREVEAARLYKMAASLTARPGREETGRLIASYIVLHLQDTSWVEKAKSLVPAK
jgi:pSer/pThr/pTyr-binding forkhead associated (FHA) protein